MLSDQLVDVNVEDKTEGKGNMSKRTVVINKEESTRAVMEEPPSRTKRSGWRRTQGAVR
jgi:hypothetical protein